MAGRIRIQVRSTVRVVVRRTVTVRMVPLLRPIGLELPRLSPGTREDEPWEGQHLPEGRREDEEN